VAITASEGRKFGDRFPAKTLVYAPLDFAIRRRAVLGRADARSFDSTHAVFPIALTPETAGASD
jgi:hypothetical protein